MEIQNGSIIIFTTEAHKSQLSCQGDVVARVHPIQKKEFPLTEHIASGAPRYILGPVEFPYLGINTYDIPLSDWQGWAKTLDNGEIENLTMGNLSRSHNW